jgi:hypothetical protein
MSNVTRTTRIAVRVPVPLRDQLQAIADAEDDGMDSGLSRVVRRALREFVEGNPPPVEKQAA